MNHQKVYEKIILKAKSEKRIKNKQGIYFEEHHIIPRCLKGSEDKENKVLLTAKEHYVCHKLLTYIYKNDRPICIAFYMMSNACKTRYIVSSRDYAYSKELFISIPVSEETKRKMSKAATGKKCIPLSNEHKQKLKIAITGKKRTIETKKKMSESQMGKKHTTENNKKVSKTRIERGCGIAEKNGMYGKTIYNVWINKFGKEIANEKYNQWIINLSNKSKCENNPMFGKSVHDIWIEKYGKEKADKMWIEKNEKQRKKILETNIKKKHELERIKTD